MERRYRVYPQLRAEKLITQQHGIYWTQNETPVVKDGFRLLEADDGFLHWWSNDRLQALESEEQQLFSKVTASYYHEYSDLTREDDFDILLSEM